MQWHPCLPVNIEWAFQLLAEGLDLGALLQQLAAQAGHLHNRRGVGSRRRHVCKTASAGSVMLGLVFSQQMQPDCTASKHHLYQEAHYLQIESPLRCLHFEILARAN